MCGRYSLTTAGEGIWRLFGLTGPPPPWPARYNIGPGRLVPVVRLAKPETDGNADGRACRLPSVHWTLGPNMPLACSAADKGRRRELVQLRWGLIPSWAKETPLDIRMINARAESIVGKPAFRDAFRSRRCLIPADGFYEWRATARGKRPYRIGLEGGSAMSMPLFAFAGLWERWEKAADGIPIESCTIVTTDANALLRPIHERMPVILDPKDYDAWLDPATPATEALALLKPYPAEAMMVYPVSARVNNARFDDLACIAPAQDLDGSKADSLGAEQPTLL